MNMIVDSGWTMDSGVGSLVSEHPVDTGKLGSGPEIREKLDSR
jgi:hypothetical protein